MLNHWKEHVVKYKDAELGLVQRNVVMMYCFMNTNYEHESLQVPQVTRKIVYAT